MRETDSNGRVIYTDMNKNTYKIGEAMNKSIYAREDKKLRLMISKIKKQQTYDRDRNYEDTGEYEVDSLMDRIYYATRQVYRDRLNILDNIYYAANNDDYGRDEDE